MGKLFSDEIQHLMAEFAETKEALHKAQLELQQKMEELKISNERLENSEHQLQQKVEDLSRNEKAMLNIIDDVRELEKKLKKERDMLKAIVSSMGEGLLVVDRNHRIILMNQMASVLLRITPKETIGEDIGNIFNVFKGKDGTSSAKTCLDCLPVQQVIKEADIINIHLEDDFYCQDKLGKVFPVSMIVASLLDVSALKENITGAVIIFKNVTKEKSLDEAKSGFISIASHQLRTPLTSIRWFSEMLINGDAGDISDEQKHFVERIYEGAERMINLVNLLLQIARVEAGRVRIEPAPMDLKRLTESVVTTLQTQLKEKDEKIEIIALPEKLPEIPMDEDVVWQIIQNLLTNAIRYSQVKGIITIKIVFDEKRKELLYSVQDKGIGIPKAEQGRIFEKFYRADNAVQYVPEGSGLGLNLVKKLVEDWEGRIWFESEESKGTTFFFTVPLEGMKARKGEVKLKV